VPYDLSWLDEEQRILQVQLYDPFDPEAAARLSEELSAIIETPRPVYVLVDIREFNPMTMMSQLGSLIDGQPFPKNTAHLERSRAAVVGGGPIVSMALGWVGSSRLESMIRPFDAEDTALDWLREESRQHLGDGPT
jgi:hypothetical protein